MMEGKQIGTRPRRRRKVVAIVEASPLPGLDEALAYVQEHHLQLHFDPDRDINLWSPHHKVPIRIRRTLRKHLAEIVALMHAADIRVCPSPQLHRRRNSTSDRRAGRCGVCAKLLDDVLNLAYRLDDVRVEEEKAS